MVPQGRYLPLAGLVIALLIHNSSGADPVFTAPDPSGSTVALDETATVGTSVYTLVATDADGDNLVYAIDSQTPSTHFTLSGADQIVTSVALDHETTDSYTLTVSVFDGTNSVTGTLTINVNDINDESPVITVNPGTVNENQVIGATIAGVINSVSDGDTGDTHRYGLSGAHASFFAIDTNTGDITTAQVLNYEDGITTYNQLVVTVTDQGGNTATASIVITLSDANDDPVIISPTAGSSVSIGETTASGMAIYTVTATDEDTADTLTYSVSATPSTKFSMTGNVLSTSGTFDYETTTDRTFTVTISVSDGTTTVAQDLTVNIQDEIDETPVITLPGTAPSLDEGQNIGTVVAGVFTVTDADVGDTLSYVLSGTHTSYFQINSGTGDVSTAKVLDFETGPTTFDQLTLTVTDSGGKSATASLSITLNDISDERPVFSSNIYYTSIAENTGSGVSVFLITVTDADAIDILGLTITSGDDTAAKFSISSKTIQTTATSIDYEALSGQDYMYTLIVTTTGGTTDATATVVVSITAVDDNTPVWETFNPVWVDATTAIDTISEDVSLGTTVVTADASDADKGTGGTLTYSIISVTANGGGAGNGLFYLDSTSGALSTIASLDRDPETAGTDYYDIDIRVEDDAGNFLDRAIRIALSDVNEFTPVFSKSLYTVTTVSESTTVGTNLLTFTATDSDATSSFTYNIAAGDSTGYFAISTANLNLNTAVDLESGGSTSYTLTVTVTDGGSPTVKTSTATVVVTVASVNEFDPAFTSTTPAAPSFAENTAVGTSVATVVFDDDDHGDDGTVTYAITDGDTTNHFQVDATSGELTLAKALDFEDKQWYTLEVTATDGGTPARSAATTFNVTVTDVSDNVPTCTPGSITATANENATVGDTVATLVCRDADTGDTLAYTILSGNTGNVFSISTAGVITVAVVPDYESTTKEYSLVVTVTGGSDSLSVPVTIAVGAVNEATPAFATNPTYTFAESTTAGSVITTYVANDNDHSPHAITGYSINSVTNSGRNVFALDESTGQITLASNIDYESLPAGKNYEIAVVATDGGGLKGTGTVTVSVTDVNDNSPSCTPGVQTISVDENTAANTVVIADLGCSDADVDDGNTLNYSLTQTPGTHFALTGANGLEVATAGVLNYESASLHELEVTVHDSANTFILKISITINDVNEGGPTFTGGAATASIPESATVGTSVADVTASDTDSSNTDNGKLVYSITAGNAKKHFLIDPETGRVSVAGPLDRETDSSYTLTIQAEEAGGNNLNTNTLTVTITDENDNSPACSPTMFTVSFPESTAAGTAITTLTCTDDDDSPTLTYTISTGDTNVFEMNAGTPEVLQFKTAVDYDALPSAQFNVIITVSDGSNSVNVPGIVAITDENEATPAFVGGPYTVTRDETYAVGSIITTIAATDDDASDTVTYGFSTSYTQFVINSNSGEILLSSALDFETSTSHELTVIASDGTNVATSTVTVSVNDINDEAPVVSVNQGTVAENSAINTVVAGVINPVTDGDASDTHTYSLTGSHANFFTIDTNTGAITTAQVLNYEDGITTYNQIVVTVTDQGGNTATASIVITLSDANDDPVIISPTAGSSVSIGETTASGSDIYTVSATDEDTGTTLAYSVSATPSTKFSMRGNILSTLGTFDYETAADRTFIVTISVSDGTTTVTEDLTVNIQDEIDESPVITVAGTPVALDEGQSIGTLVPGVFSVADADAGDTLSYVLAGTDTTYFQIDSGSGQLSTTHELDYEAVPTRTTFDQLTLTVTDSSGNSDTENLIINLNDVSDNSPVFNPNTYFVSIDENTTAGTSVVLLTVTDADASDTITLNIVSGDDATPKFVTPIVNNEIQTTATPIDYEALSEPYRYTLIVTATDGTTTASTATVIVSINAVDETSPVWGVFSPTWTSATVPIVTIPEDTALLTTVVTIVATDADEGTGGTVTYSLVSVTPNGGGASAGLFSLDQSSGVLSTIGSLNRDPLSGGTDYFDVVVRAVDDAGNQEADRTLRIGLSDINEFAPAFSRSLYSVATVSESTTAGTSLLTFTATDSDATASFTYTITAGDTGGYFAINTAVLNLNTAVDLESGGSSSYQLTVTVTDGGSPTVKIDTATVVVTVASVNEDDPVFGSTTPAAPSFAENTVAGASIATVAFTDADSGDDGSLTYSITAGDPTNHFQINARSGLVTLAKTLDFETTTSYTLEVTATDGGTPARSAATSFTITVTDASDNAPTCTPGSITTTVNENANIGDTVATLACSDTDTGDTITYTIASGNTNTAFDIDAAGVITLLVVLDYEGAIQEYSLVVTVRDGTNVLAVPVAIAVVAVNEDTPAFGTNPTVTIAEDESYGSVVTTYAATDSDVSPHAITGYRIASVTNTGLNVFSIEELTGQITLVSSLDYESLPAGTKNYEVVVIATDGGGLQGTGTVTVSVTDVNDNTPTCTPGVQTITVDENTVAPTILLASLGCSDADVDDGTTLVYTLSQSPGTNFELTVANALAITAAGSLDYETDAFYELEVTVSDGTKSVILKISIAINDINEGGPTFSAPATASISESSSVGSSVADVTATDADSDTTDNGRLLYSITAGNTGNHFLIDQDSGRVSVAAPLDRENIASYTLTIQAEEAGRTNSNTNTLTITIIDENDNNPVCSPATFATTFVENTVVATAIETLACTDADDSPTLTYTITTGDTNNFEMNTGTPELLQFKAAIDYDALVSPQFDLVITVSDGTNSVDIPGSITITDVNEATAAFVGDPYAVNHNENYAIGSLIATVVAADADASDTVTYGFTTTYTQFTIDSNSGEVLLTAALDWETSSFHVLSVTASDGTNTVTGTLNVTVTDVNDNTPVFGPDTYSATVSETAAAGAAVVTVVATDADDLSTNDNGKINYIITDGNTNTDFLIDQSTGAITTANQLDYETTLTYSLTVEAVDRGGAGSASALTGTAVVVVTVGNENEHDPTYTQNTYSVTVSETTTVGTSVTQVVATDNDNGADGEFTYSMATHANFYLKEDTGLIELKALLDYETATSHSFEVVVTDKGTTPRSATATVSVIVSDENDHTPLCSPSLYTGTFSEDTATTTSLAQLTCSDGDTSIPNNDITYTIVSVNGAAGTAPFAVGSTTGQFTLDSAFDYETTASYTVLIDVVDGGTVALTTTATVNIQVTDVNEAAPVFTGAPFTANVAESAAIGNTVIVVAATDADTANSIVYSFNPTSTDFAIDPDTGEVLVTGPLDSETTPTYTLTVFATDTGNPSQDDSTTITLTVVNTNDAIPVFSPGVYTLSMVENTAIGTTVESVTATDADSATITYSIASGNVNNIFGVTTDVSNVGHITVDDASNLDYETTKAYALVVEADDGGGQTATTTVYIQVTGHNEHTPTFNPSGSSTQTFAEDTAVGTIVVDIDATDSDDGVDGDITFSILSGDLGKYAIDQSTGVVTTSGVLDMETTTEYTMEVQAIDAGTSGGQLSATYTLTVSITDVNDNIPVCTNSLYTASTAEDTATTTSVAQIVCSDDDNDPSNLNNALTYLITNGNTGGAFAVSSTGEVTVSAVLDRETTTDYLLGIEVADQSTGTKLTTTTSLTIIITDINDNTPAFTLATYPTTQAERIAIGTTVATVTANDVDSGDNGAVVYSITGGNTAGKFAVDSATGDVLLVDSLDYESDTSFSLTVQASDKGTVPLTDTAIVEVTVTDENDNSPLCAASLYSGTITESSATSTTILTVACTDQDSISTITYSITSGNTATAFLINPTTGELSNLIVLDAETVSAYTLTVQANDGGTLTTDVTIEITVTDENDNVPVFNPARPYTVSVDEDTAIASSIFDIDATDADITTTNFVFSITNGNIGSAFFIDSSTGEVQIHQPLDRETSPAYTLSIEVTDGTNPAQGTTLTVTILDKNDNYPSCTDTYTKTLSETVTFPDTQDISCTDADASPVLAYSITSGNGEGRFSVGAATGLISINSLDYESTTEYIVTVEVADGGTDPAELTSTMTYIVYVSASNEGTPTFTVPPGGYIAAVSEDAALNSAVVTMIATDTDVGGADHGTITYSIIGGDTDSQFYINPSTGDIAVGGTLDWETTASYTLTVEASDMTSGAADQLQSTTTVAVTITDVNDNAPTFNPVTYSTTVLENAATSTTVLQLTASDPDDGTSGTAGLQYTITNGNTGGAFSLSGDEIVLAATIDKETVAQYQLTIEVADQGTNPGALTSTTTVVIDVEAVNEHTPIFSDTSPQSRTYAEDVAIATTVYTAAATDLDTGSFGVIRYFITAGNTNNAFLINEFTGDILVWQTLDYDTLTSYALTVEARDNLGQISADTLTATMTVNIALTDVNDHTPTYTTNLFGGTLPEDSAVSTSVATVVATDNDSDLPNNNIVFSIVSGDGSAVFTVDAATGVVSTTTSLDYEAKDFYYLVVQALDTGTSPGALSSTCLVTITVTDVNDGTPSFDVTNYATLLSEDVSINTPVTTVVATDADSLLNNNNVFTYSTTSGTFSVDPSTGVVSTNAVLDRENTNTYVVEIEAADQGGTPGPNTGTATVTIILTDVNDNTPFITGTYDTTISEDTAANIIVHTIVATDADIDENGQLTYTIQSGNANSDFVIDSGTGLIQVANALDYETTRSYELEVVVSDSGLTPNSNTVTATVSISDINDNSPTVSAPSYSFTVDENVPVNTGVDSVVGSDLDSGINAALVYTIASFTTGDSTHFIIDAGTGEVRTNGAIDRETLDTYVFTARVSDTGTPTLTVDVTVSITVNDLNDNTPAFNRASYTLDITENAVVGTSLLQVVITDPDIGVNSQITLSIDTGDAGGLTADTFFEIDSATSILSVKTNIDRESIDNFGFNLIATDAGTPALSSSASVTVITVEDENDNNPIFNPTFYNSEIAYNDHCQGTVTTLTATDADQGVNAAITYSFAQNDYPTLFAIDGTTGDITQIAHSTVDTKYLMYGAATDGGTTPNSAVTTATIRVDTYNPDDVVISVYMDISKSSYISQESTFLSQLTAVFQTTYPTSQAKRWCIDEPTSTTSIVHLYVIADDVADDIAEITNAKTFLTSTEAYNIVAADDTGTPGTSITGSSWDPYRITEVEKYFVPTTEESKQLWIETAVGITVVSIISAIGLVVIILITAGAVHYWRKGQRSVTLERSALRDAEGAPRAKFHHPKGDDDDIAYEKSHPPPAVAALPMPAAKPPMVKPESNKFEKPKLNSPYHTPNTLDLKQEREMSSPARKKRAPAPQHQKPQNRVSPILGQPGGSESGADAPYIVLNRQFDGRAVDPDTGRLYEYNTQTNERRWVNTPDGKEVRTARQDDWE